MPSRERNVHHKAKILRILPIREYYEFSSTLPSNRKFWIRNKEWTAVRNKQSDGRYISLYWPGRRTRLNIYSSHWSTITRSGGSFRFWTNMSNTNAGPCLIRYSNTERELKIRRAAKYFWRISWCFKMWSNSVLGVWLSSLSKLNLRRKRRNKIEKSTLIKIRYPNTFTVMICNEYENLRLL